MKRFAVLVALLLFATPAWALPTVGAPLPAAHVEDADGRGLDVARLAGKPVLIVYEDKDSATLNQALKDDLAKLAKGDRYKSRIALVPVADVDGYDYWPVRGFVKDAIRSESRRVGATIYCDWDGSFRSALSLRSGTSSVVLVGKDGKVLWARDGVLTPGERARLIDLLKTEVGP